ncbi:tRNA (uracil-5-)-methyltransferase homolog A-like [Patiria miniata]|uniref:Uncharacterized protein n=1 Tax=Patiria miniata TaxID=46514 RepID=A0A914A5W8_PATMI|nr:tRNA (uracil-5-)-methyltransferase homolog A-like [Patiria miniata]
MERTSAESQDLSNIEYVCSKAEVVLPDVTQDLKDCDDIVGRPSQAWHILCRPISNRSKGIPFRPTKAVAVDLFPHTKHCELVILFDRVDSYFEVSKGVKRSSNTDGEVSTSATN